MCTRELLRPGRRPALGAALVLLATLVRADDDQAPALPRYDLKSLPLLKVSEVVSATALDAQGGGKKQKLSLAGVAAPSESAAEAAQSFLHNLLAGESIHVVADDAAATRDADGRARVYVFRAPDGAFVNLELVRLGYLRLEEDVEFRHQALFRHYQEIARKAQKGIWKGAAPPPTTGAREESAGGSDRRSDQPRSGAALKVYVTKSGKKYHLKECKHISAGAEALTVAEAKQRGYTPCLVCKPPK